MGSQTPQLIHAETMHIRWYDANEPVTKWEINNDGHISTAGPTVRTTKVSVKAVGVTLIKVTDLPHRSVEQVFKVTQGEAI